MRCHHWFEKIADGLVRSVNELYEGRKEIKYYNRDNKLDETVNVRKEWKTYDLLIYTPAITCAVNFPRISQDDGQISTAKNFQVKCVTTSNTGTSHRRDMMQASYRVLHGT